MSALTRAASPKPRARPRTATPSTSPKAWSTTACRTCPPRARAPRAWRWSGRCYLTCGCSREIKWTQSCAPVSRSAPAKWCMPSSHGTPGDETQDGRGGGRGRVHRLRALHRRVPGRRDRRCAGLHAHGGGGVVHWLRALRAALPGRLHRYAQTRGRMDANAEARRRRARPATAAAPRRGGGALARGRRAPLDPGGAPRAQVNPAKRRAIYERLRAANPNPTTELKYGTPFELLVAVVLSAQATDKSVNLATEKLFPATPEKIVKLGVAGLEESIKRIGLYRMKAKNVVALSKIILARRWRHCPASAARRRTWC